MSNLPALVAAEVPVCTAAILAALTVSWRRSRDRDDGRDKDLARQSEALAVLVAAQRPMDERLRSVERRTATLSEATAALAATLEAHQRWGHAQPSGQGHPPSDGTGE